MAEMRDGEEDGAGRLCFKDDLRQTRCRSILGISFTYEGGSGLLPSLLSVMMSMSYTMG